MLSVGEGFSCSSLKTVNLGIRGSELDRTGLLTLASGSCSSPSPCWVQVLAAAGEGL